MQNDNNLQAQFDPHHQHHNPQNPQNPPYPPASYPSLQQYNQYAAYPQNPQPLHQPLHQPASYPSYNPPHAYPQSYGSQNPQGQYTGPSQYHQGASQTTLAEITHKINSGHGCYMCLVYFELILTMIMLILGIVAYIEYPAYIVLDVLLALPLLCACFTTIKAKQNYNQSKQFTAFVLFIIATCISIALTIVTAVVLHAAVFGMVRVAVQGLVGLILIMGSYSLLEEIKQRDNIINGMASDSAAPYIRA